MNHADMVKALAKPGIDILESLTPEDCHALHMLLGITGEVGELVDAVKKAIIYRKPIDLANAVEELGDIEFYLEGIRQGSGVTREQCIELNILKLQKRYSDGGYSDKAAQDRADKVGE